VRYSSLVARAEVAAAERCSMYVRTLSRSRVRHECIDLPMPNTRSKLIGTCEKDIKHQLRDSWETWGVGCLYVCDLVIVFYLNAVHVQGDVDSY
jgi:hypothetical protein